MAHYTHRLMVHAFDPAHIRLNDLQHKFQANMNYAKRGRKVGEGRGKEAKALAT